MCWPRFAPSTACCVSGKRCARHSTVLQRSLPIGCVLIVNQSGSNAMVLAARDSRSPVGEAERLAFVEEIGQQGRELLDDIFDPLAPEWLRSVPAVEILR